MSLSTTDNTEQKNATAKHANHHHEEQQVPVNFSSPLLPRTLANGTRGKTFREEASLVIDAGVLRKALRLIHCLQKERGATCAHQSVARNNSNNNNVNKRMSQESSSSSSSSSELHRHGNPAAPAATAKPLSPARRDTDRAFALLLHNHRFQTPVDTDLPMEQVTLDKIRKLVLDPNGDAPVPVGAVVVVGGGGGGATEDVGQKSSSSPSPVIASNHHLLKSYSTLIQSLSHEYILRHTAVAKHRCDELQRRQEQKQPPPQQLQLNNSNNNNNGSKNINSNSFTTLAPILRVSQSSHALNALLVSTPKSHRAHKRTVSNDAAACMGLYASASSSTPATTTAAGLPARIDSQISFHDAFDYGVPIDPEYSEDEFLPPTEEPSKPPGTATEEELGLQWDFFETSDDDHLYHSDEERVWRLLHLLDVFVRLKESTGVERATLASIVMDTPSSSSSRKTYDNHHNLLLNDLVTEVENQRRQIANLHRLLPRTGALHDLVSELVRMSPQMKRLQDTIVKGFDSLESTLLGLDFHRQQQHGGGLWNLLTLYIDKLHSLELLIVQEVECCIGLRSLIGDVPMVVDYSNSSQEATSHISGHPQYHHR